MKILAAALLLTLAATSALAQNIDHLWRSGEGISEDMRRTSSAFTPDVRLRVIVEGDNIFSDARGLKLRDGQYYIFYDYLTELRPANLSPVNISPATIYCERPIPAYLGQKLEVIWNMMLQGARGAVGENEIVSVSGVSHITFTSLTGGKPVSGLVDVDPGETMKALAEISALLRPACEWNQMAPLTAAVGKFLE